MEDITITAPPGAYKRGNLSEDVISMLLEGASYRKIQAATKVSTHTIAKYRRYLKEQGVVAECGCGEPAGHKGWCKSLFEKSAARQAAVKALRGKGGRKRAGESPF